jgi:hypothetical protein
VVTFAQLRGLDSEMFRRASAGYSRLSTVTGHGSDTVDIAWRDLGRWGGDAGEAANQKLLDFRTTFEQQHDQLSQLDVALADHASRMEQQQRLLADVVIDISSNHSSYVHIDLSTGQVTPVTANDDISTQSLSALEQSKQLAQQYTDRISRILTDTATIDADTAKKLTGLLAAVTGDRPLNASQLLASIPPRGTDPKAVRDWWNSLSPQEREFLIRQAPDQVGWLDGVPAADRDQANRLMLESSARGIEDRIRQLEGMAQRSPQEQKELEELKQRMVGINAIRSRMAATGPGQERLYLMGFDTKGNGHAIVTIGNPDTADNVVTYVPGTGCSLDHCAGDVDRTDRMTQMANSFDPSHRTASVMWIGYDSPQNIVPQATKDDYALGAEDDLSRFQNGLRVTHDGPRSHNTVIGHSYGSTVVGFTARDNGLDADDMIFVGSPGVGVDNVGGLHGADGQSMSGSHVWSSHARNDPIQYASYDDLWPWDDDGNLQPAHDLVHGNNPSDSDFGARTFTSDPGKPLTTAKAHSQYWDPYSSSLRNMTYVITGRYGEVG